MKTLKLDESQLSHLADILLGAAHADADYDGREAETIALILDELVRDHEIPMAVSEHIQAFSIDDFSVSEACGSLHFNAEERHSVFALLARVVDADDVLDFSESAYIKAIAKELGAKPHEYEEYIVEFIEIKPPTIPQ